ncbi:hypothetical protein LTR94_026705, partial [Friedmanniomyces endolithicus]
LRPATPLRSSRKSHLNDLNVIDRFLQAFITYIDSGFGLLGPDVGFLTATLIGIDITLAGLFWAMGGEDNVIGRFLKKILYVGAFAFILNSFSTLADIIFRSFAQAGLTAGGGTLSADDLLKPGRLAGTGFSAAWPLLEQASEMVGFTTFFDNFLTIMILLFAWALVIVAFFILAVQMFICILEFKLTSLAGFVLIPFGLFGKTAFLAERVLGNVVASGVKVLVLAVIVGIGSTMFDTFVNDFSGQPPALEDVLAITLAALTLTGLSIFGPGIASGLVSGAPQLSAGAAIGTGLAVGGVAIGVGFFLAVSGMMSGSQKDFIKTLVDSAPHIIVTDERRRPARQPAATAFPDGAVAVRHATPRDEVRGLRNWAAMLEDVRSLPGAAAAPALGGAVSLTFAGRTAGVDLTGVDPTTE